MIEFRQKIFSEYDAMRSLYVELMKNSDRTKFGIIDQSSLLPILKGNNVVIERFVISTKPFTRKQKYRMYLKVGARAKMPDEVKLPNRVYDERLLGAQINFNGAYKANDDGGGNQQGGKDKGKEKEKDYSETSTITFRQKEFGKGGPLPTITSNISPYINITHEVEDIIGEAVEYDKKSRSLVLEHNSIQDAIRALNILPFGIFIRWIWPWNMTITIYFFQFFRFYKCTC